MPIFEYKCEKCGQQFEAFLQRSSQEVSCSSCGSKKLTRLFSAFAARSSAGGGGAASCSTST